MKQSQQASGRVSMSVQQEGERASEQGQASWIEMQLLLHRLLPASAHWQTSSQPNAWQQPIAGDLLPPDWRPFLMSLAVYSSSKTLAACSTWDMRWLSGEVSPETETSFISKLPHGLGLWVAPHPHSSGNLQKMTGEKPK